MSNGESLLTIEEAAQRLQVPVGTARHFVRRGDLPGFRLPDGRVRIEPSALEAFLDRCRTGEAPA